MTRGNAQTVHILMYHSISDGAGPTCIAPETFRRQMDVLAECGYRVIPLSEVVQWSCGDSSIDGRVAALTFDDGFADFASVAFPELHARRWTATVFVPAGYVGRVAQWDAPHGTNVGRRLMDWNAICRVANAGIDVGGHSVKHADLTSLSSVALGSELVECQKILEGRLSRAVRSFAAPYGRTNPSVRAEIARHYDCNVGTTLAAATADCDPFDLPRIEMYYFRDIQRWRAYLDGRASGYMTVRRILRKLRHLTRTG